MTDAAPTTEAAPPPECPGRPRLFPWVLLSALLMTLAFPPVDAGWLAWVALAPLFWALPHARRARHAFALAYLFGYLHWGATIYWIGTTVANWTHSPIGWVALFLLTAIKSCWFGLFGALAWCVARRADNHGALRSIGLAAAWTVVEWLRGQTNVAMPWSLAGYSQYRYLPLIQVADLAGVYAVSFAVAVAGACVAQSVECLGLRVEGWRTLNPQPSTLNRVIRPLLPAVVCYVLLLVYGVVGLRRSYDGTPVSMALMQPNIASVAGSADRTDAELTLYESMARDALASAPARPRLMVWPESTATDAVSNGPARQRFEAMARSTGSWQLVGTGYEDAAGRLYNSAALFSPDGQLSARYDKYWLVPMGEWVPLRRWMPFGDVFHFPPDTTRGQFDRVISGGPVRMSVLICYESVFPVLSRARVASGANLLVSITNDSWAGESPQLQQHVAMAAFRAVETRRYLASSATTGITALIDPRGRIAGIPPYREDFLACEPRLRTGLTPYVRFGDWFVVLCAAVIGAVLARKGMRHEA